MQKIIQDKILKEYTKTSEYLKSLNDYESIKSFENRMTEIFFDFITHIGIKCHSEKGNIYYFNSQKNCWEFCSIEEIKEAVKLFINAFFRNQYAYEGKATTIENIVKKLSGRIISQSFSDIKPRWMNFRDGVYDIVSGERVCNSDQLFFKYSLPFKYNQIGKSSNCPKIKAFIYDVCKDDTDDLTQAKVDVLMSFVCYSLLNFAKIEKCLVLYGVGRNGKSTFLRLWEKLIGKDNVSHCSLTNLNDDRNAFLFNMEGKLLNISSESKFTEKNDIDKIKKLISREPIVGRRLYQNEVEVDEFPLLVFATNDVLQLSEHTEAIYRRFVVVEFKNQYDDTNGDIVQEMVDELPAFFNWAMQYKEYVLSNKIKSISSIFSHSLRYIGRNSIEGYYLHFGETIVANVTPNAKYIDLSYLYSSESYGYKRYCVMYGYKSFSFDRFLQLTENNVFRIEVKRIVSRKKTYYYVKVDDFEKCLQQLFIKYKVEVGDGEEHVSDEENDELNF